MSFPGIASEVKTDHEHLVFKPVLKSKGQTIQKQDALLQFKSGGHILGFKNDRVYIVGSGYALIEEFVGALKVKPVAAKGNTIDTGVTSEAGLPVLGKVSYNNLWKGITAIYVSGEGGLAESTFVVNPYADADQIRLRYNVQAEIQKDGSLRFRHRTNKGYFIQSAPVAWQEIKGKRVKVDVAFEEHENSTLGFKLGTYDRFYPVVIDPAYQWHTFYGSSASDYFDSGRSIAVDGSGNIYVTGYSYGSWQGDGNADPIHPYSADGDIFVLKLNSDGVYQWHTFYGSGDNDYGTGIAVDGSGNIYVTGYSYGSWQGAGNTDPIHPYSRGGDIFILKLNSNGVYQWHTFYGSGDNDYGTGIAVDGSGSVYVTGYSYSTWQGDGDADPIHPYGGDTDIFVMKLSSNGVYQWHTFYGSGNNDYGTGLAVDSSGSVYVTGYSYSAWQGDGNTNPIHPYWGDGDIFVIKVDGNGAYGWHTFYGSDDYDYGSGIAVDGSGGVYVTGWSAGTWQGDGGMTPIHTYSGYGDIFLMRLSNSGLYQWHTFYGSSDYYEGSGIAADKSGNVYVTGYSYGTWQGDGNIDPIHAYSGDNDIFVLKLNSTGAYRWHTFYGSSDYGIGTAVDGRGNVYVIGDSYGTWQGDGNIDPIHAYSGGQRDIVVLKLTDFVAYTLIVSKTGTGDGTITSSSKGINCGAACDETFLKNAKSNKVTLKVKPDANSTFLGWGADCQVSGTKTSCKLTMDSDKNVTASFGLPDIVVSPDSYDFGDVTVKQSSSLATFTIQNNGPGNLKMAKVKIIGTDAKMFKMKSTCKKVASPGSNCQLTVTFKPKSAGSKIATLQITSNDPDTSTIELPVSGTGI
jgi:hypothetical protein